MKKISSCFHPWGAVVVAFLWGLPFLLAGIPPLRKHDPSGLLFCGIGLVVILGFALSPKPKYAAFDDKFLYLRGCFVKDMVPLRNVEKLTPYWMGKGAFWIEFKSETRFKKRVFVSISLRELLRNFHSKSFNEIESVQALLKAIEQVS